MNSAHRPPNHAVRIRPWEIPLYAGVAILFFSHFTDWTGYDRVLETLGRDPGAGFVGHLALSVGVLAFAFFYAPERSSRWTSLVLGAWAVLGIALTHVAQGPRSIGPWAAALGWGLLLLCAVWGLFVPREGRGIRIGSGGRSPSRRGKPGG